MDEFNKNDGIYASVVVDGLDRRMPRETELVLYRVGQEALSNVSRHAGASEVIVTLRRDADLCVLQVSDNGIGFDPARTAPNADHGLGLVGMRERVAMVGGDLVVASQPGAGTQITARVPWRNGKGTNG